MEPRICAISATMATDRRLWLHVQFYLSIFASFNPRVVLSNLYVLWYWLFFQPEPSINSGISLVFYGQTQVGEKRLLIIACESEKVSNNSIIQRVRYRQVYHAIRSVSFVASWLRSVTVKEDRKSVSSLQNHGQKCGGPFSDTMANCPFLRHPLAF